MRIKSKTFQDTFSSTPGWCSCSEGWWHFPEPQLCVGGRWAPAAAQAWRGSSKRKVQEESNQPCKRNPALLCLAKCCKILDKPGLVAFFLSNSVLRFPEFRQQPEQALRTLKCTSLENSTFSPFGLQFLMLSETALFDRGAHTLCRALAASEAAQKNWKATARKQPLAAAIYHPQLPAQSTPPVLLQLF